MYDLTLTGQNSPLQRSLVLMGAAWARDGGRCASVRGSPLRPLRRRRGRGGGNVGQEARLVVDLVARAAALGRGRRGGGAVAAGGGAAAAAAELS